MPCSWSRSLKLVSYSRGVAVMFVNTVHSTSAKLLLPWALLFCERICVCTRVPRCRRGRHRSQRHRSLVLLEGLPPRCRSRRPSRLAATVCVRVSMAPASVPVCQCVRHNHCRRSLRACMSRRNGCRQQSVCQTAVCVRAYKAYLGTRTETAAVTRPASNCGGIGTDAGCGGGSNTCQYVHTDRGAMKHARALL